MGGGERIKRHTELQVYTRAFELTMDLFRLTRSFPVEERYSLTEPVETVIPIGLCQPGRSMARRRYQAAFIAKLSDAEAEVAESQVCIQFAVECEYLTADSTRELYHAYDEVIAMLVAMIPNPERWLIK